MSALWIAHVTVHDDETYGKYAAIARSTISCWRMTSNNCVRARSTGTRFCRFRPTLSERREGHSPFYWEQKGTFFFFTAVESIRRQGDRKRRMSPSFCRPEIDEIGIALL